MLPLDTFHTIAEVGIAITGFAGIVAVIRGGADSAGQPSVADPLWILLGASISTVFFCFVPEWLHAVIASPDAVWRVSLAAYGTYRLAYIALILNAQRRGGGKPKIPTPAVGLGISLDHQAASLCCSSHCSKNNTGERPLSDPWGRSTLYS